MEKLKKLIKTRFCILLYAVFSVIVITVCIFVFGKINGIIVSFFVIGIASLMYLANKSEKEEQKELSERPFKSNNVKKYATCEIDEIESRSKNIVKQYDYPMNSTTYYKYPMTGKQYEHVVGEWLALNGFTNIQVTPVSGDYGVDIVAIGGCNKYAVQCKFYTGKVGVSAIHEVAGGMAHYGCDIGMVVTNSTFTDSARTLARENGIILKERVML